MARKSFPAVWNVLVSFALGLTILAGGVLTNNGRYDSTPHAANVGFQAVTNAGVPSDVTGSKNGDVVLDTSGSDLYARIAGVWTKLTDGITSIGDTITSATEGSVLFAGASGVLAQDNTNFKWDDTNNRLSLGGIATPLDTLDVMGTIRLTHTSTHSDDHGLQVDLDAAGFGDAEAMDISYTTGDVGAGSGGTAFVINIDESDDTGGSFGGINVFATETGSSATVHGIGVGATVHPSFQVVGTGGNMDSALVKAVDSLTAFTTSDPGGANNVTLFVANSDTVTIGDAAQFNQIEWIFETFASGAGIMPTFEFSTGVGTWGSFTPLDSTNGFKNNGTQAWVVATTIPTWATGTGGEFLIRITRTQVGLGTTPVEDLVQIVAGKIYQHTNDARFELASVGTTNSISDVFTLYGRDVDGASDTAFFTITAANDPTADLSTAVTIGGNAILSDVSTVSALTTVGALNSGSITTGFGAIDNGTSNIRTGGTLKIDTNGSVINGTGTLTMGSGSESAIYWNATNLEIDSSAGIDFSVSGTPKLTMDSSGDVFLNNGNVLVVGHTSDVTSAGIQALGTGSDDAKVSVGRWSDNSPGPRLDLFKSRGATVGSNAIVQDNDFVGLVRFLADDGVDFLTLVALMSAQVDDASPAAGDIGTAITWQNMPGGGGALRETMRLSAAGNLGIGTIDPQRPLDARTITSLTNTVSYAARLSHITSGTPANDIGVGLEFEVETSASNNEIGATIEAIATDATAASEDFAMTFSTMTAGATATEKMRIDSLGNLGIGTVSPGATLELDGTLAYTPSTTQNIVAGTGITVTNALMRVQGSGGAVTVTATPNVADGVDGECVIIQGDSDTNTLTLQDESQLANSGLQLAGGLDFVLGVGDMLEICYDLGDDNYYEVSRSNN